MDGHPLFWHFLYCIPRKMQRFGTASIWLVRSPLLLETLCSGVTVASQSIIDFAPSGWASSGQASTGRNPPTPPTPSSQHFPAGAAVPATAAQFSTAIFEAAYRRAAKFPCLCQSLKRRGEYCSPSHKSSCAHKGKYLCWAAAWQSLACLFFSAVFFFSSSFLPLFVFSQSFVALSFFPAGPRSPTHSFFLYIFSKPNPKLL